MGNNEIAELNFIRNAVPQRNGVPEADDFFAGVLFAIIAMRTNRVPQEPPFYSDRKFRLPVIKLARRMKDDC
jgi:hypothetical protein